MHTIVPAENRDEEDCTVKINSGVVISSTQQMLWGGQGQLDSGLDSIKQQMPQFLTILGTFKALRRTQLSKELICDRMYATVWQQSVKYLYFCACSLNFFYFSRYHGLQTPELHLK
jgi:hypothetical protein